MNFYASRAYLEAVSSVYFSGKKTQIQDFEVDGQVYRFLVVGGRKVLTSWYFLDYVEPLAPSEIESPKKRDLYIELAVRDVVTLETWESAGLAERAKPAPYVDFGGFAKYDDYRAFIVKRSKDRFKKNARLRERLAEDFGELTFTIDDLGADVIDLSLKWKRQQILDTQLPDMYVRPENYEFFHELRRRKTLRASTLRANGRLLSSWLGFVHDGVWSGWIFTYDHDPALKKYSLGWQLMDSMLEECFKSGLRGFDFSVGSSDYKFAYGTHVRVLGTVGRPPLSQRLAERVKEDAKRLLQRYPKVLEGARTIVRNARTRAHRS
jgi:CelD/BcsL family acetyltransferase involved in cellulose biosynthesis